MEEMMMNINFDDGTTSTQSRKKGSAERKSKQVIITHPELFHCRSHLGLIKTMKIGLVITRIPAFGGSEEGGK